MTVGEQSAASLHHWAPESLLEQVSALSADLSRGFLRSRPQEWFPGFASQWLPLFHSLSIEAKVQEVSPRIEIPAIDNTWSTFEAQVDGEAVAICLDQNSAAAISGSITPGTDKITKDLSLEYIIRRLVGSLALSWSGGESNVAFIPSPSTPISNEAYRASIKLSCTVNALSIEIWFLLGSQLISKLDTLWRGQLRSSVSPDLTTPHKLQVELTQLAVPPAMLADYTRSGTMVDLELPVGDRVYLRLDGKPWLPGQLCICNGQFAVKILSGPLPQFNIPGDASRLSIDLGELILSSVDLAELGQIGALVPTHIPVSGRGRMMIHDSQTSEVEIGIYEGKFAVRVL